jgi:hypothetical protein
VAPVRGACRGTRCTARRVCHGLRVSGGREIEKMGLLFATNGEAWLDSSLQTHAWGPKSADFPNVCTPRMHKRPDERRNRLPRSTAHRGKKRKKATTPFHLGTFQIFRGQPHIVKETHRNGVDSVGLSEQRDPDQSHKQMAVFFFAASFVWKSKARKTPSCGDEQPSSSTTNDQLSHVHS